MFKIVLQQVTFFHFQKSVGAPWCTNPTLSYGVRHREFSLNSLHERDLSFFCFSQSFLALLNILSLPFVSVLSIIVSDIVWAPIFLNLMFSRDARVKARLLSWLCLHPTRHPLSPPPPLPPLPCRSPCFSHRHPRHSRPRQKATRLIFSD